MRTLAAGLCLLAGLAAGCDAGPPAAEVRGAEPPVVVFASHPDRHYLPALFLPFTRETGIPVIVRHGAPDSILADVTENRVEPPADLVWSPDVTGLVRAAGEGALRPTAAGAGIPPELRDPDGFWVAISFDIPVIAWRAAEAGAPFDSYAALAGSAAEGRLCLASGALPGSRAVLAALLGRTGVRRTEAIVRRWIAGLARPVFASPERLLAALGRGECGVAIVLASRLDPDDERVAAVVPLHPALVAEGAGIARHARNPDGAEKLLAWLTRPAVQARHAAAVGALPAHPAAELPPSLGWLEPSRIPGVSAFTLALAAEEAALLAERAGYRE
ncbi:MAG: substrate-binding domain-containing protein [Woeseiaceae bacterium]|nr:substrate-binding domain-containing protein [Woeseiaceae bacterium]